MKDARFVAAYVSLFAALSVAACEKAPTPAAVVAPPAAVPAPTPAAPPPAWSTDRAAYPLVTTTAPAFSADLNGGGKASLDTLRGHWTILEFWGLWSDDAIADARFTRALVSAAGADPDLEFLSIHTPPGPGRGSEALGTFLSLDSWFKSQGGPWPTAMDTDGKIAEAFRVTSVPTYLLIGPDLTIEGYRGQLASTPDEGIKSVIKGYAEIRKQIAAPD
jgi:hypothetical protein